MATVVTILFGHEAGDKSLTTLAVSYMAEDFVHWDYNPTSNQWSEVQQYKVNYTGTNFDDAISYDNTTSFKSEVGSSFTSVTSINYTFSGGSGDDQFIGSTAAGVKNMLSTLVLKQLTILLK